MNHIYLKNIVIYSLLIIFMIIITSQLYNKNIKEGLKVKNITKSISKGINKTVDKVSNVAQDVQKQTVNVAQDVQKQTVNVAQDVQQQTEKAAEEAKQLAEKAAEEAKKIAEQLNIQNALGKLIDPILNLKNNILNTFNFFKQI